MSPRAPDRLTSAQSRGVLPMLTAYVRAYPGRSAVAVAAIFLAGLLDGLGLSTLLSMLTLATGESGGEPSVPEQLALQVADWLGVAPTTGNLLLLATALISLKAVLSLLANRQVGYTVAYIATDLRMALIRAVMQARWSHYQRQSVGRLSNAVATEAERASQGFMQGTLMTSQLLNSVIYIALAFAISWQAGLAAMVAGALLLGVLHVLVRISRHAGQRQTGLLRSMLSLMTDQLTAVKPLKAMAREEHVDALLLDHSRELKRSLRRQVISKEALRALQEPMLAVLVGIGFFLSLVVLEMGLAEVLLMVFLLARVVNYLAKSQRAYQQIAIDESAYWSIREAIEEARSQLEPPGGTHRVELERGIHLDGVTFQHPAGPCVLDRQSITIPARQLTLIVGPSGAGKTTLLDIITGLIEPDSGRVLIDEEPLAEMNLRHWRRQIGYVPQDALLVSESVAHNLTLGDPDLGDDDVRRALQAADAWDFVQSLPEGIHTNIGERAGRLSGGQRQRLAIARALIHRPRLLILDEATSNLDSRSEAAVLETIRHLRGKLTILAVAHRGALAALADQVFSLTNGVLTAESRVTVVNAASGEPLHDV